MDLVPYKIPPSGNYRVVILIKTPVDVNSIEKHYVNDLHKYGVKDSEILIVGFEPQGSKKDTIGWLKNNLDIILSKSKCKMLMVCDSKMYEYITDVKASKGHCSYDKSVIFKYEVNCVPVISYKAINFNPQLAKKLSDSMNSLDIAIHSLPKSINVRSIKDVQYPTKRSDIFKCLRELLSAENLAIDIETFGLDHLNAGIGTISFSKHKNHAIAFCVDYQKLGERINNTGIKSLLKWFFQKCKAKFYFHRGQYDLKILIYELFMEQQPGNYTGFVEGMRAFKNFNDTLILTYVCTNNTTQNTLNLKDNTIEFSGNYAIDIKDITKHEPKVVLEYNARDTCNTMYLWEKYADTMYKENQVKAYEVLRNTVLPLVQADIHGLHISKRKAVSLEKKVRKEIEEINNEIKSLNCVKEFREQNARQKVWEYNLKSKSKIKQYKGELAEFNPNSSTQVSKLLHDYLGIEVLDRTKKGQPSVTVDSLLALKHHLSKKP